MTDKKITPIQTARNWARQHPDASGLIVVKYLAPKGRSGRRGMATRRDHYLVQGGNAAKLTTRTIKGPTGLDLADIHLRVFNGYCYRCGGLYLEPVLRIYYIPNPRAGQPSANRFMTNVTFGPLGHAALCPSCAQEDDVVSDEQYRANRIAYVKPDHYSETEWLGGGIAIYQDSPLAILSLEVT